jgi:glucokinase
MIILFDIGGTHTRVAVSKDGGGLDIIEKYITPEDFSDASSLLITKIEELVSKVANQKYVDSQIEKIAGCLPGITKENVIINSPNLPKWNGYNIATTVSEHFNMIDPNNIKIVNDADLACLGEAVYGAGKGYKKVAYMTVSTGVGGGFVVDGKIASDESGIEPGHQIINHSNGKTLEEITSGTAIKKLYGSELSAIEQGLHKKIITESSQALAIGIKNMITNLSPDIFVLGGSVILDSDELFNKTKEELFKITDNTHNSTVVARATLGDQSGLYGALALARAMNNR